MGIAEDINKTTPIKYEYLILSSDWKNEIEKIPIKISLTIILIELNTEVARPIMLLGIALNKKVVLNTLTPAFVMPSRRHVIKNK